jgi:hypothetical protein
MLSSQNKIRDVFIPDLDFFLIPNLDPGYKGQKRIGFRIRSETLLAHRMNGKTVSKIHSITYTYCMTHTRIIAWLDRRQNTITNYL